MTFGSNIPTQNEEDQSTGSSMGRATGRMADKAGNPTTGTDLQKRDVLQQEIDRQGYKIQPHAEISQQLLSIQAWGNRRILHQGTYADDQICRAPDHQPREADENAKQYEKHAIPKMRFANIQTVIMENRPT